MDLRTRLLARSTPPQMRARVVEAFDLVPQNKRCEVLNADGAEDGPAVLRIYDEIHWLFGIDAEAVAEQLSQITASEIEVQINSPGGDVFDGLAIMNSLRTHPARITTRVDGIAASAASVIVQAGDQRLMVSGSQQMIHEAWGVAIGPAEAHREMADLLDKQNDIIAGIYAARSERDADAFRETMRTDTYMSDQEAVDMGLADEVYDPPRKDKPPANGTALNEDHIRALIDEALNKIPVASERQDTDDDEGETPSVDSEQATALLAALTWTPKEANTNE